MTRIVAGMFPVGLMVLGAGVVSSQDYPNKPVRIVTSEVGGATEVSARLVAQGISGPLGQQVIVDNRGGSVGPEIVSRASPDGYTLFIGGGLFWLEPLLHNTRYDPIREFSPISLIEVSPNLLVMHPSVPVNNVKELIALAKARPGELNYASSVAGSSPHLAAELFKAMAGVNIVRIIYKGGGPALNGLLSGETQMFFSSPPTAMPLVKSGKLRALAVTSAHPSVLVPGMPTVAASVPGYEMTRVTAMFAPAKTPATIINRLNREIARFLTRPEVKEKFLNVGSEVVTSSPEQLAATMKADMTRLGKVIKDAGIRAD